MIKWNGTRKGRPCIGFGLEEGNLARLREGKPIVIFAEEMGLPHDVFIYYGKDMDELIALSQSGIKEHTVIKDNRNKPKH